MAIEFKLPPVSEGVESVDVAEIRVAVGDTIEAGAVICEVETDKSVAEVECPHAGKITKILVEAGQSVAVGTPLVLLEAVDAPAATDAPPPAESAPAQAATAEAPTTESNESVEEPSGDAPAAETSEIEYCLPTVSEGVESVDIAEVLVSVGDVLDVGAVICEVETDKSVAEVDCPYAGTIKAVHVKSGDTIRIGAPLITIETTSAAPGRKSSPSAAPASPATDSSAAEKKAAAVAPPVARPVASASVSDSASDRPPAPAGPATRRLARKLGVDLYQLQGSAKGGRIVIEDVEAWVRDRLSQPAATAGAATAGLVSAPPLPDFSKFGPIEKEPLNKIARTAAANLHAAWVTIPHVTQHNLADITELEAARKRYVKDNPKSPKITMTAIMIKAVVGALRAFPKVNSSLDMESGEMILKQYYHIGVAVDTPNGLVVPVIRNCDQKNVLQVAAELSELAAKARDRKLKTEDMQGASFTITNLGGIGGTYFTPIVNYPEVAILGMSRGSQVLQLEDGNLVERLMLPLSLSYDHRAINGADAARFIVKLSSSLTNFFELF